MSDEYPRILLVTGQAFNQYTGTGITLTNLFRGWPADRIAMIHQDDSYGLDDSVCQRFYQLGTRELGWIWPLSELKRKQAVPRLSGPASGKESTGGAHLQVPNIVKDSVKKRFYKLAISTLGGHELLRQLYVSDQLKDWIESFRPELVYSEFSTITGLRFVREIISLTGVALATHTLDDWPQFKYRKGPLASFVRFILRRELQDIFDRAALRMGICDKMCREYEARYGLPFVPFHNVVEAGVWEKATRQDWSAHKPFHIVYSGNIGAIAKIQSLLDICHVVRELHGSGMPIELRIHTLSTKAKLYRSMLESSPSVTVHDPPENAEFVSLLSGADLLVLPVDFGEERIVYYKYSMPTRVPAYMMSGTPILVYGPPEVASVEYAQTEGWGYIVPNRDMNALREAIILLATDVELRRRLGQRAREVAIQNHDATKIREAFRQALADAATYHAA